MLQPNSREAEEGTIFVAKDLAIWLPFMVVLLTALGAVIVFGVGMAVGLAGLMRSAQSATVLVSLLLVAGSMAAGLRLMAADLVSSVLRDSNQLAHRLLSVVPAGLCERLRLGELGGWVVYLAMWLPVLASAIGLAWLFDHTAYGRDMVGVVLGKQKDLGGAVDTLLVFLHGTVILLVSVFAVRMPFSTHWLSMLTRVRLKPWPAPDAADTDQLRIRIAHLSDLHAQVPSKVLSESGKAMGSGTIEGVFRSVGRQDDIAALVISGDLTDDGTRGAWNELLGSDAFLHVRNKTIIAPGNHDLNQIEIGKVPTVSRVAKVRDVGRNQRALRFLQAAEEVMGTRAWLICPFDGKLCTLGELMARAELDLQAWSAKARRRSLGLTPSELLKRCFPMIVTVESGDGHIIRFMIWNSVMPNRWPLLNALGDVDQEQLDRGDKLLAACASSQPLVHVIHHQLGLPSLRDMISCREKHGLRWLSGVGMTLSDPRRMTRWLARRSQRSVLLHGHHHKFFVVDDPDAQATIVSAPSATQGCEESYQRSLRASHEGAWLRLDLEAQGPHVRLAACQPMLVGTHDASE
jgi:predicted phosphodiesterase